jgi:hypothetical protein
LTKSGKNPLDTTGQMPTTLSKTQKQMTMTMPPNDLHTARARNRRNKAKLRQRAGKTKITKINQQLNQVKALNLQFPKFRLWIKEIRRNGFSLSNLNLHKTYLK